MSNKTTEGTYRCFYCEKEYPTNYEADMCRDSHDLILVALTSTDINQLVNYLYRPDEEIISPHLVQHLKKYLYSAGRKGYTK